MLTVSLTNKVFVLYKIPRMNVEIRPEKANKLCLQMLDLLVIWLCEEPA